MMLHMRTTVTIDEDIERLLREDMHRKRKSFKQALNDALRLGLRSEQRPAARAEFVVKSRPMHLLPGLDPAALSDIDTELEIEEYRRKTKRLARKS